MTKLREELNYEHAMTKEAIQASQWKIGAYNAIHKMCRELGESPFDEKTGALVKVPAGMHFARAVQNPALKRKDGAKAERWVEPPNPAPVPTPSEAEPHGRP